MAGMTPDDADAFLGAPLVPTSTPGPAQPRQPPTPALGMSLDQADAFLGAPQPARGGAPITSSNPATQSFFRDSSVGRILSGIGQGWQDGFGTSDLGLDEGLESSLQKAGILSDVKKGQTGLVRAFNDALIKPAAVALDAAARVGSAAYSAAQAGVEQAGTEVGAPEAGREIAQIPDAFMGSPGMLHVPPEAAQAIKGAIFHPAATIAGLNQARQLGVIGESEAVWKGTADPAPLPEAAVAKAGVAEAQAAAEHPGEPVAPVPVEGAASAAPAEPAPVAGEPVDVVPTPPADVHGLARQIAPETFNEYDALTEHRDGLRDQIDQATADLQKQAEAQAPNAAQIADLQARMEDATPRMAKKYQARLDALQPAHDAFLNDDFTLGALTRDTPEITAMRQQLLETDYRMRDLSPDVSAAYAKAAEQMPAPEEAAPEAAAEPAPEPVAESALEPAAAEPAVNRGNSETTVPPVASIAEDTSRKLQAAGRPADEADAAGQVTQALWQTRAAAFEGRKGTAEEMYAREAPEIRGERTKGRLRAKEMAQAPEPQVVTSKRGSADNGQFNIHADGKKVGEITLADGGKGSFVDRAQVDEGYQGRGYAQAAYNDIESKIGRKLLPSPLGLSDSASRFWSERLASLPDQDRISAIEASKAVGREYGLNEESLNARLNPILEGARSRASARTMAQGAQGKIRLATDGRAVITLMKSANASTFIHETGHDWLERMMQDATDTQAPASMKTDAATVRDYLGVGEGEAITTKAHEKFARSFERYFMEGRAPSKALAGVFGQFRQWLTNIYQTVAKLRAPITSDIRDVFDRLLSSNPERQPAIVPEAAADMAERPASPAAERGAEAVTSNLANLHEADLAHTEPQDAVPVADKVHEEVNKTVETHEPEVEHEFARSGDEPAGSVGGDSEAPGDSGGNGGTAEPVTREAGDAGQPNALNAGGSGPAADGDSAPGNAGNSTGRASERPDSANAPFGRSDTNLVDKAGNIRLDNLNQPEDVNAVIRQTAAENDDFIGARRGVISDAETLDLADALGMTPGDLNQRTIGQAFNAEQVVAARKLLIQSATTVRDAMAKAATGSDADVLAYGEARARHLMIQEQVSGLTAEAGRALRAFRSLGEGENAAKQLGDFLQANTGKTLFQMRREAKAGMLLDTPSQVSKFVQDSAKPTFGDMALEYWINGLISGPATHTTYAIGNALLAVWKAVPETAVAAAIGKVRTAFGGDESRVYAGEVGAGLYGILKGQRNGIQAAWKAGKSGLTTELPGESEIGAQGSMLAMQPRPGGAIPGVAGTVARLPARGVAVIHSYFRAIGYTEALHQLAYRTAAAEGLDGNEFATRVGDLTTNPSAAMMEQARDTATTQTMMGGGGEFTRKLADLTNTPVIGGWRILKVIDPFVKIGSNVMTEGLMERSPLGLLSGDIRANLMGRNGAVARDSQIARIAVGSALGASVVGLASQGYITGGGPSDPKQAAMWRLAGNQPYSVRIGDTWYGYHRLGSLAMVMGVAADMHDIAEHMETQDIAKVGSLVVGSLAKSLLDESFMRGPGELMQAIDDPDRYGDRYVRNMLGTLIPFSTGMAQMARATDPYAREARSVVDAIKARIPFLSQTLFPRRDVWGQPVPNMDDLGAPGLTAISETAVNNDPVNLAILRLGNAPAQLEHRLVGVPLNDQQYDDYSKVAGQQAKMMLNQIVRIPGFSALPDGTQAELINSQIKKARRDAQELMKLRYPSIVVQAMQDKRDLITTGRKPH